MTAVTWLVVIGFYYPGNIGQSQGTVECSNMACVYDTIKEANTDPYVVRIRVLRPGDGPVHGSNHSIFEPVLEQWRT